MKLKFAFVILLSGILFVHGQDSTRTRRDKFTSGDLGLRYQLAYNGGLQSQFTVSGFVAKRVEVGGTFSLNLSHISSSYQGTAYQQVQPNDSVLVNYQTTNNGWGYTLGFSPFMIGHFPLKGKFDFYLGGMGIFQISNTGTNSSTFFDPITSFQGYGSETSNPVQFTLGLGYIIGCQYFLTKRLALGIQVGEWAGYTFAKPNAMYVQNGTTSTPPYFVNNSTPLNFVATSNFGFYAGITLSYYFSAKRKAHTAV